MNILIRADSSSQIGTGHIMRDLVLVNQFSKDSIIFASQELDGNINFKIKEARFDLKILKSNDFEELDHLIKSLQIDMIIIDHYDINYNFEKQLKIANPKLKIFVFDDTYEKHCCDILLNHNISGDYNKYKNLVPKECELRCGEEFTLLRDEFLEAKKEKITLNKDKKTIFIAMGGADHKNLILKILKIIKQIRKTSKVEIFVNVVTTFANANLEELKIWCKTKKWINLEINSNQIAKLMINSDFAIVTPSVTVNEVYYLDLPMIAIKTASNQKDMHQFLKKNGYLTLKKFDKNILKRSINVMIRNI